MWSCLSFFFKDIDDQLQKNIDISIDFKIILSKKFHDLINVFFKSTSKELTSDREHDHKKKIKIKSSNTTFWEKWAFESLIL